jgi:glycogen debranching enzyme
MPKDEEGKWQTFAEALTDKKLLEALTKLLEYEDQKRFQETPWFKKWMEEFAATQRIQIENFSRRPVRGAHAQKLFVDETQFFESAGKGESLHSSVREALERYTQGERSLPLLSHVEIPVRGSRPREGNKPPQRIVGRRK